MNTSGKDYNWGKLILGFSYIYLTIPFIIFSLGYLKIWIALPIAAVVIISLYLSLASIPDLKVPAIDKKAIFKIGIIMLILFTWVFLSGIGKIAWQNGDHNYRNGIYEALVEQQWPVGHGYLSGEGTDIGMLVYYIGFWMLPSVFGKIFGIEAGYMFQVFWAMLGLTLVYGLICVWRKKISVWPLIVFVFFSGMDIIFNNLFSNFKANIFSVDFLEFAVGRYCYSSFFVGVSAVFNQTIAAWLVVMALLLQKTNKNLVFLLSSVMLSAVFPFIGLIPFVVYWALSKYEEKEETKELSWFTRGKVFLKNFCTFQNIAGGGTVGIISYLYLKGNNSGQNIQPFIDMADIVFKGEKDRFAATANVIVGIGNIPDMLDGIMQNPIVVYCSFILLEVGVYFIVTYSKHKKNKLYYIMLVSLLIIPFIQVGSFVDFCMRASIPAILLLYLFVVEYLEQGKRNLMYVVLIGTLVISSLSAFHEMGRAILYWDKPRQTPVRVEMICQGGNFGGSLDTFFFQKLCKPWPVAELDMMLIEYCDPDNDEFWVEGSTFSKEKNSPVATQLLVEFDRKVSADVLFEDGGMLDDNLVSYRLTLNGHYVGVLDYEHQDIVIPQEYFNEAAQRLQIDINQEVKLYATDNFKMYALD